MNFVSIAKFPVIAPDGTQFRVKIVENDDGYFGPYVKVILYRKRKRFGFRKIWRRERSERYRTYDASNPDYVALACGVISEYYETLAEAQRAREQRREQRAAAMDAFNAWDGHIDHKTEVPAQ